MPFFLFVFRYVRYAVLRLFQRLLVAGPNWVHSAACVSFQYLRYLDYLWTFSTDTIFFKFRKVFKKRGQISQSQVCSTCRCIDFAALLERHQSNRRAWRPWVSSNLGTVQGLLARRQYCDLCSLIAETIRSDNAIGPLPSGQIAVGGYIPKGPGAQVIAYPSNAPDVPSVVHLKVVLKHSHGYEVLLHLQPSHFPLSRATRLTRPEKRATEFGCGRLLEEGDDKLGLYRDWLSLCEGCHSDCNAYDLSIPTAINMIKLLDIRSGVIVDATSDTRYAALSYVWGPGPHLKLTRANTNEFMTSGVKIEMTKSIRDAIKVLKALGIHFLWVDTLCIVQDDPAHKTEQLAQMASIYAKAVLVIAAAAGQNADAGLFPLRNDNLVKQKALRIGRSTLITKIAPDNMDDNTQTQARSKFDWSSRAWTFQEILFARRALVCRADQTYWHCRCALYYEETAFESSDPVHYETGSHVHTHVGVQQVRGVEISIPGLRDLPHEHFILSARGQTSYQPLLTFNRLVSEYTSRFMTKKSDMSAAFCGVKDALECHQTSSYDGWPSLRLLRGCPRYEIGWALAWSASDLIDHDRAKRLGIHSAAPGIGALNPSWSWMSWYSDKEGKESITMGGSRSLDNILIPDEEITFYAQSTNGALYVLPHKHRMITTPPHGYPVTTEPLDSSVPRYSSAHWKEAPSDISGSNEDELPSDFRDSGILKFYTSTATLPILRCMSGEGTYEYDIVGIGYLQQFCRWEHQPGEPEPCRCPRYAVGSVQMGSTDHIPYQDHESRKWFSRDYRKRLQDHKFNWPENADEGDFLLFDFCIISRSCRDPTELNALIVEWIHGVAYRIGIATIPEQTWVHLLNRRWRLVTLG